MSNVEHEATRVANSIGATTGDLRVALRVAEKSGNQFTYKPDELTQPAPNGDGIGGSSYWGPALLLIGAPILYVLATVSQHTLDIIGNVTLIALPIVAVGAAFFYWRRYRAK